MENRRIQAFSRVEMVVVAVCAALVLFVTLPSLTGAREAGKRAICLANLKTLGAGMLQYAQDDKAGKIPVWGWEFDEVGRFGTGSWNNPDNNQLTKFVEWGYIWEYVQNKKPFVCPALNNKMNPKARIASGLHTAYVWGWPDGAGTTNPPGPMWSYCVNMQAGMSMGDINQYRVNPELVMPSPKTVFMLYEGDFNDYAAYDNSVVLFNSTYNTSNNSEDSLGRYHLVLGEMAQPESSTFNNKKGSGNLVFFDGHVGTLTLEEFIIQRSTPVGTLELCGGYMNFKW